MFYHRTMWNPEQIIEILSEASQIAMKYFRNIDAQVKEDKSLVTQADLDIEAFLIKKLTKENELWLIGEESISKQSEDYILSSLKHKAYIVDPIDGTAPYANGLPSWGISIGYTEKGVMTEGAVYLPVTGELYISDRGKNLYTNHWFPWNNEGERAELELLKAKVNKLGSGAMVAITQGVGKRGELHMHNPIQALACAVVPLCYLLHGRYLAYTGKLKVWDMAGAFPLLKNASFVAYASDWTELKGNIFEDCNWQADANVRWRMRGPTTFAANSDIAQEVIASMTH
jgi:myo-inositol-1(or 4)-monophosphatase